MWLALGCAFAAALRLRGAGEATTRPRGADVVALLRDPRLRLLLAIAALHWICLAPYNVYFGIFLRDIGLGPLSCGLAYSTGVVMEVIVLMTFHRLEVRFRLPTLLAAAFAVSAARWLAIALCRSINGATRGRPFPAVIGLAEATRGLTEDALERAGGWC